MNYIKEINAFRNYLRTNSIPAIAQALWYAIIDYHNHSNWEPWITIDNLRLMADLEISKGTLIKHRNILIQNELLLYKSIPRKKNSGKYCLVSLVEKPVTGVQTGTKNKPDSEPDKPNNQSGINFEPVHEPDLEPECEPECEPDREPVVPGMPHCEPLLERHKLKTKLNKKDNTTTPTIENQPVDNVDNSGYVDFFNNNFGHLITQFEMELLESYVEDGMEPEVITLALQEAVESNKRDIRYAKAVLNRWKDNQLNTVQAVMADKKGFELKKNQKNKNKSPGRSAPNYGKKESTFNNFKQRNYDFEDLEKKLLGWEDG
ncbi:DnaD domain protein [Clostridium sp. MT-14]|uniref:DnaD domain protein n=1 Tax=Clostridium sp. MT-14 TaxID=3348360 RepID=UPI0035F43DDD